MMDLHFFHSGSQRIEERELEPWDSTTGVNGSENVTLELDGANGWDPNDMFRKNEQIYGVQSTYDHTLSAYTVPLQSSDSADYRCVLRIITTFVKLFGK